ncbi:MAG: hypothetical protein LBI15_03015 [Dysgonamonadaceae bacterium]|jgi:hypothetical protein|nr:hypothetical protein [Dysgonamonadaceae bacterium]
MLITTTLKEAIKMGNPQLTKAVIKQDLDRFCYDINLFYFSKISDDEYEIETFISLDSLFTYSIIGTIEHIQEVLCLLSLSGDFSNKIKQSLVYTFFQIGKHPDSYANDAPDLPF